MKNKKEHFSATAYHVNPEWWNIEMDIATEDEVCIKWLMSNYDTPSDTNQQLMEKTTD